MKKAARRGHHNEVQHWALSEKLNWLFTLVITVHGSEIRQQTVFTDEKIPIGSMYGLEPPARIQDAIVTTRNFVAFLGSGIPKKNLHLPLESWVICKSNGTGIFTYWFTHQKINPFASHGVNQPSWDRKNQGLLGPPWKLPFSDNISKIHRDLVARDWSCTRFVKLLRFWFPSESHVDGWYYNKTSTKISLWLCLATVVGGEIPAMTACNHWKHFMQNF